ncbi:hypothetical protein [Hoeflea ulvae]|uniref:site-specific DNA-methyltransferase (cytosine-N(4)-specific) n=1 Tax=Hoeflea ulvae TaxID=2983764 RepID=A0ABT3YBM6_9HYPH|nr:hypothetical protein [Hoeflea ulvae]MCY0093165.1 site-specific DNA-methyltransferase [Hoeflea ulvae]
MKHIHPFPARMAPEIALYKIQMMSPGDTILDPMAGSGMVLSQAARNGVRAVGIDMDPLAELIARVGATPVNEKEVTSALEMLLEECSRTSDTVCLPWMDEHQETSDFAEFWFAPMQRRQLRKLSFNLIVNPIPVSAHVADILKVALSRLIVTKEPKASLARDTAHSRPHRTIIENSFDILAALPASLAHILSALDADGIEVPAQTHLGDARNLTVVENDSIDCIVTSPPYLNAIDYMRGHRLSLVWLGYDLVRLRSIRSTSIGAERALNVSLATDFDVLLAQLGLAELNLKNKRMLDRYFVDLTAQTKEAYRVLKPGAIGTYVIGNSTIRGTYVQNSELLKRAAMLAGFIVVNETEREIPNHRRYMPMFGQAGNSLASRMRTEHVVDFQKPKVQ